MSWLDVVGEAHFLRLLFPGSAPVLENVRLQECVLHQDGPRLLLRFDLEESPRQPPRKWAPGFNTVQVRLMGIGVREISIEGWSANNIGSIRLTPNAGAGVSFEFASDSTRIVATFDFARVDGVSGYQCSAREAAAPPPGNAPVE